MIAKNKKQTKISKKGQIGVNTIFYIMMALFMAWILIFGYQKLFLIQDQLSETERIEIKNNLKKTYEYCNDPLNSGNIKYLEINNNNFNGICILGSDFENTQYKNFDDFSEIYKTDKNVILLKTKFKEKAEDTFTLESYEIIDTIELDIDKISETFCKYDKENIGKLNLKIECK